MLIRALGWLMAVAIGFAGTSMLLRRHKPSNMHDFALRHLDAGYAELRRDSIPAIKRARDQFAKAAALDDGFAPTWAAFAEAELALADALVAQAPPTSPDAPPTSGSSERAEEAEGLADQAFVKARRALGLDSHCLAANRALADYYRLKRADAQMTVFVERMRAIAPEDVGIEFLLGARAATQPETLDRAMGRLASALRKDPDYQRARFMLARVCLVRGDRLAAMDNASWLVEQVPDHTGAQGLVAELREHEEALRRQVAGSTASAVDDEVAFFDLLGKANELRSRSRPLQAQQLYQQAQALRSNDPRPGVGIGWCLIDLNKPADAIPIFQSVVKRFPRTPRAYLGLGEAARVTGRTAEAEENYRRYLDMVPDGPDADMARRMLKVIGGSSLPR